MVSGVRLTEDAEFHSPCFRSGAPMSEFGTERKCRGMAATTALESTKLDRLLRRGLTVSFLAICRLKRHLASDRDWSPYADRRRSPHQARLETAPRADQPEGVTPPFDNKCSGCRAMLNRRNRLRYCAAHTQNSEGLGRPRDFAHRRHTVAGTITILSTLVSLLSFRVLPELELIALRHQVNVLRRQQPGRLRLR